MDGREDKEELYKIAMVLLASNPFILIHFLIKNSIRLIPI